MKAKRLRKTSQQPKRVVIVGAGFGGLAAARRLRNKPGIEVLVLDRRNHHTFSPLLYEVASAGLEAGHIAQPVRAILRGARNIRFRMTDVTGIDVDARTVLTDGEPVSYDYLIVAAGSVTNFFGIPSAAAHAMGLKDLTEATAVRNRVLRSFERASVATDAEARARLMTIVIIGGGPTGVELAGALAELNRHVLARDYPDLDMTQACVILLEATDHLLGAMPARLQEKAAKQLRDLGVEVRFGATVADVSDDGVTLTSEETITSSNVVWVAGVRGEPLGESLRVTMGGGGRVRVEETMRLPGHADVFIVGDLAYVEDANGRPYPMIAPVAMQEADLAARNIRASIAGERLRAFRYRDRGTMATIGRRKAVAKVFGLELSGFVAWVLWLSVHLIGLIGLRNRALVLLSWTWNYFRYDRAHRLVTDEDGAVDEAMIVSWAAVQSAASRRESVNRGEPTPATRLAAR